MTLDLTDGTWVEGDRLFMDMGQSTVLSMTQADVVTDGVRDTDSVVDTIDHALEDHRLSVDAMRWTGGSVAPRDLEIGRVLAYEAAFGHVFTLVTPAEDGGVALTCVRPAMDQRPWRE